MTSSRPAFLILIATIFLLPLFFIPMLLVPSDAQALLAVFALAVSGIWFLLSLWRKGEFALPKHHLLTAVLLLPLIYLLSALLSTPSSLSLLGYNFEVGTFGSVALGAIFFLLIIAVVNDAKAGFQSIVAFSGALFLLSLFAVIKLVTHGAFLSSFFAGRTGNPLGNWTDLAMALGLLALLATLTLGILPMKGLFRAFLYIVFALATVLLVVVHFTPALALVLAGSVFLFFYFSRVEKQFFFQSPQRILPIILGLVALLSIVNPTISPSKGTLSQVVSNATGVSNAEVHPTLSTTLSISKAVLTQQALFGSGPNTFGQDWLAFKPVGINATPYWSVAFPFGSGFIPTQVAATGVAGSLVWLALVVLLVVLALKVLAAVPESRAARFGLVTSLMISFFLWAAFFLYMPSLPMLLIAFAFTGVFLALSRMAGFVSSQSYFFVAFPGRGVAAFFSLAAICGLLFFSWTEVGRTMAATHFNRASELASTPGASGAAIEGELGKAITAAPLDSYYLALAQFDFAQAQALASATSSTPQAFQTALGNAIGAARTAANVNPGSYANWLVLGNIYAALVPKPLAVQGAYESAQAAYNNAFKLNPADPSLPLQLARLEVAKGNADNARSYVQSALTLKSDYPDAYLLLAQIEASANNLPAALASTQKLAQLVPNDVGVRFELGLLKYSSADYQGAFDAFTQALALQPNYANAKYYQALSLWKLGHKDQAKEELQDLLALNPGNAELQAALTALSKPAKK